MKSLIKWVSKKLESYEDTYKKIFLVIFLSWVAGFVICEFCFAIDCIYVTSMKENIGLSEMILSTFVGSAFFGGLFALIVNIPIYFLFFRKFPAFECFLVVFPITFIGGLIGSLCNPDSGYFILGSLIGLVLGYLFYFLKKSGILKFS
jgi:hypothetical protein